MASTLEILIQAKDQASGPIGTVKGALSGLETTAKGTSTATIALGNTIANLATSAISTGISKLTEMASSVLNTGLEFNNLKQQSEIAFTTMLGSGQTAQTFLQQLADFAAQTPFEFPDLVTAAQRMLAMGFQSDAVLPTLRSIGDAVAGLGGSSALVDRVTTALGQMQAKGKASGEEMMQLTEAGIPAWQFLADKIGVTVPEAMDNVTKGTVSAETVIGAMVDGMNAKFGGMMEQQALTFGGLKSTISDTFTFVSGTIMEPFFAFLTEKFQWLVDFTSSPTFSAWVDTLRDGVERLTTVFSSAFDVVLVFTDQLGIGASVSDALRAALSTVLPDGLVDAIFNVGEMVASLTRSIAAAIGNVVSWQDVLYGLTIFIAPVLLPAIWGLISAIAAIAAPIVGAIALAVALRVAWQNDWGKIRTDTLAILGYLQDAFGDTLEAIQLFGGGALEEIIAWATGNKTSFENTQRIWDAAKLGLNRLKEDFLNYLKTLAPQWTSGMNQMRSVFTTAMDKLGLSSLTTSGNLTGHWNSFVTNLTSHPLQTLDRLFTVWIPGFIFYLVQEAKMAWNNMVMNTKQRWQDMVNDAKHWWGSMVDSVLLKIEYWAGEAEREFTYFKNILLLNIWGDIRRGTELMWGDLVEWVIEKWETWFGWFKPVEWYNKAVDIVQGFWDGIKEKWNGFTTWFKGKWEGLRDGFKNFFGIQSPSTMFKGFGENMGEGLADGIESAVPDVETALGSLTSLGLSVGESLAAGITSGNQAVKTAMSGLVSTAKTEIDNFSGEVTSKIGMTAAAIAGLDESQAAIATTSPNGFGGSVGKIGVIELPPAPIGKAVDPVQSQSWLNKTLAEMGTFSTDAIWNSLHEFAGSARELLTPGGLDSSIANALKALELPITSSYQMVNGRLSLQQLNPDTQVSAVTNAIERLSSALESRGVGGAQYNLHLTSSGDTLTDLNNAISYLTAVTAAL